jgi:flagellar basal-body rod protein FlgF
MLKGIYSAAAGMTSQMIQTDTIADNLANISTPGYKTTGVEFATFGDVLVQRIGGDQEQEIGRYAQGSQVLHSVTDFSQGDLNATGNPLDLALEGDGFFTIKLPDKNDAIVYSRAGNFTKNEEGILTTPTGGHVQGLSGDIVIPKNAKKIDILRNGDVLVDNNPVDKLKIAQFGNNQNLRRTGSSYYTGAQPTGEVKGVTVEQGFIERSNANAITEMVNSMTGLRVYESLQKSIQMQNETLGKSVNEVGKVL